MTRIAFINVLWLLALGGWSCTDAVYTLGQLPRDVGGGSAGSGATSGTGGSVGASGASGAHGGAGDGGIDHMCSSARVPARRKAHNLFILIDNSFTIPLQFVWAPLTQAISRFVDDPAHTGLGIGAQYYKGSCNPTAYEEPVVPIAPLPGVASAIKASFPALPTFDAAITPGLTGSIAYARQQELDDTTRETDVLFISDGLQALDCGNTLADAREVVEAGVSGSPAIRTHVLGIRASPSLLDPVNIIDLTPLHALALAGGTEQAEIVQMDGSSTDKLTAALETINANAAPCAFEVPESYDPSHIALEWNASGPGSSVIWPQVLDAAACGNDAAMYIDADSPAYLQLCPAACALLRNAPLGEVYVRENCS